MAGKPGWAEVARAEWHSATRVTRMLRRGLLAHPRPLVGSRLRFDDGSVSVVFRETVARVPTSDPALLVVEFRLRLLGTNPLLHALFRAESWLNTLLFAGFEGFRSKLWLATPANARYRGVYEWDGADRAHHYAQRLVRVLGLFSQRGTVRYHVEPGTRRDDFLRDPRSVVGGDIGTAGGETRTRWWSLQAPIAAGRGGAL